MIMNRPQELAVKVGTDFHIDLPSNRTTGYRWQPEYDSTFVLLIGVNYDQISKRAGAGGTESFTFKSLRKGRTIIRMRYGRPWENKTVKEHTYRLVIIEFDQNLTTS